MPVRPNSFAYVIEYACFYTNKYALADIHIYIVVSRGNM